MKTGMTNAIARALGLVFLSFIASILALISSEQDEYQRYL